MFFLFVSGFFMAPVQQTAKKWLSAQLIERAWTQTRNERNGVRPWPWMKSVPVARITVPRLDYDFVVMKGASGAVLAHAPGWHDGTVFPGQAGISLFAGYHDAHFRFLHHLKQGDRLNLHGRDGRIKPYRITAWHVVDKADISIARDPGESVLLFSTSFPFAGQLTGQSTGKGREQALRFVVVARALNNNEEKHEYNAQGQSGHNV